MKNVLHLVLSEILLLSRPYNRSDLLVNYMSDPCKHLLQYFEVDFFRKTLRKAKLEVRLLKVLPE